MRSQGLVVHLSIPKILELLLYAGLPSLAHTPILALWDPSDWLSHFLPCLAPFQLPQ